MKLSKVLATLAGKSGSSSSKKKSKVAKTPLALPEPAAPAPVSAGPVTVPPLRLPSHDYKGSLSLPRSLRWRFRNEQDEFGASGTTRGLSEDANPIDKPIGLRSIRTTSPPPEASTTRTRAAHSAVRGGVNTARRCPSSVSGRPSYMEATASTNSALQVALVKYRNTAASTQQKSKDGKPVWRY
jgi:hypothetical protein